MSKHIAFLMSERAENMRRQAFHDEFSARPALSAWRLSQEPGQGGSTFSARGAYTREAF